MTLNRANKKRNGNMIGFEIALTVVMNMLVVFVIATFDLHSSMIVKIVHTCMVVLCLLLDFEIVTHFMRKGASKIEHREKENIDG